MPSQDPEDLADSLASDMEKAVEKLRRQRGELYDIEHAPQSGGLEPIEPSQPIESDSDVSSNPDVPR